MQEQDFIFKQSVNKITNNINEDKYFCLLKNKHFIDNENNPRCNKENARETR